MFYVVSKKVYSKLKDLDSLINLTLKQNSN